METRDILSVGIDIGTTTTQLIFSKLRLVNRAGPTQVPRFEFAERRILFSSPVVFTPKDARGAIRRDALEALVRSWFALAGMTFSTSRTGAVIITGESLKATNAASR
jgi:ethanolamine utilization protein EutA